MEQAPDLKDLMRRYFQAESSGDITFTERVTSSQGDVLVIGTDPDEWWDNLTIITKTLRAQAQAGVQVLPGDLLAYREGSVGWVADRGKFLLPDGTEVPFRWTAVFHQEDGEWKLVQGHASIGVPNVEVLGTDLNA